MANDNQTALQQSIQRKKDRIFELEELNCNCSDCIMETKILTNLITEDEKLLPTEKEQLMMAFVDGKVTAIMNGISKGADDWYRNEFEQ